MSRTFSYTLRLAGTALVCFLTLSSSGQLTQTQLSQEPHKLTPPGPVSLPHLYWHFLMYQYHLDEAAAALEKQGKDGAGLRNALQHKLGFTNDEFAAIRRSATRLATEIKPLDSQAKSIIEAENANRSLGSLAPETLPQTRKQLLDLTSQRDSFINAEISNIGEALSPNSKKVLETFLTTFFAPGNSLFQPLGHKDPKYSGGQSAVTGVR